MPRVVYISHGGQGNDALDPRAEWFVVRHVFTHGQVESLLRAGRLVLRLDLDTFEVERATRAPERGEYEVLERPSA